MNPRIYEITLQIRLCMSCKAAQCNYMVETEPLEITVSGRAEYSPGHRATWSEWDGGDPGEPEGAEVELLEITAGDWCGPASLLHTKDAERAEEALAEIACEEARDEAEWQAIQRAEAASDRRRDREFDRD